MLEARLITTGGPRVLKTIVTGPGETDEIIELRMDEPKGRRRPWPQNATSEVATDNSSQRTDFYSTPNASSTLPILSPVKP